MDFPAVSAYNPRSYADASMMRGMAGMAAASTGRAREDAARSVDPSAQGDKKPETGKEKTAGKAAEKAGELTPEQQAEVRQLQKRDREVRQHEMAHLAASGGLATSGAIYSFQRGPDGQSYAVGGEVNIDVSKGRTPQETISRAQTIIAAALAPAEPSGADRAVAAQARQMQQQAMIEAMKEQQQSLHPGAQDRRTGADMYRHIAGMGNMGNMGQTDQGAQMNAIRATA